MAITNLNGVDLPGLKDEATFIETLTSDALGESVILDYWQRTFLRDERRAIAVNKSRQVGYSYAEAAKALAKAHLNADYRKYFVSVNLDEAKNKIRYVRQLYSTLPSAFKLRIITDAKTEVAFEDSKGRVSLIKALTSREPRGMSGDISLDEIAHYVQPRKILEVAGAVGIRGGWQLSVGSSPLSQDGPFWEIITNYQNKYNHFGVYSVPWWFSRALCTDVIDAVKQCPTLSTAERVARFGSEPIQEAFAYYDTGSFAQEYECGFIDEASAFMPYELIRSCWQEDYGEDATDSDVGFLCLIREFREGAEPTESMWEWVRANTKGLVEFGYDVGRKKDMSVLVVTDEVHGVKEVRAIVVLFRKKFDLQERLLSDAIRIVHPQHVRIDATGMGIPLAESMQTKHGSVIVPHTFTNPSKGVMVNNIKARFEKRTIRIPAWQTLVSHIHSIKRAVTASNNVTYEADASEHHGDIYWALALTDFRGISEKRPAYIPKAYRDEYDKRMAEQRQREVDRKLFSR